MFVSISSIKSKKRRGARTVPSQRRSAMYPISPCENVEYNDFFVTSSYGLGALQRAEQRFQDGVVSKSCVV